jgi:LmbE family N-acetylglucosaminyl deacetylase
MPDVIAPDCALAIAAHPDDAEFGGGATLAGWAAAGTRVCIAVCTDGSAGTWDPAADLGELVRVRAREQREALAALTAGGARADHDVVLLGWKDGELSDCLDNRRRLDGVNRKVRPSVVLTHDPWKRYRLQTDHRVAGFLASDAVDAAADHHSFPEQGPPHRVREVLYWEAEDPDLWVPAERGIEAKLAALRCFRSQYQNVMGIAGPDQEAWQGFRARVLDRLRELAAGSSWEYAEAFKRVPLEGPYAG